MRLLKPRIAALSDQDMTAEHRKAVEPLTEHGRPLANIFRTIAQVPEAASAFLTWGFYVLSRRNSLPGREREIVILRAGYLCKSGYEFAQHHRIGLRSGLSEDEISRIKQGADAGWSLADAALIRATDEIVGDHFITDPSWQALMDNFTQRQAMDVVFTASQYVQVSTFLNCFGVQLEDGTALDPALDFRK